MIKSMQVQVRQSYNISGCIMISKIFSNVTTVISRWQYRDTYFTCLFLFIFSENMDLDSGKKYNTRTKLDEHGNYPVWMNSRQIKKQKKKNKTQKTKRAGKAKK